MLLGVTLLKKKYPMAKYLCVLLIGWVALFHVQTQKSSRDEEHTIGYGELLLVCNLLGKEAFSVIFHRNIHPRHIQKASYVLRDK